MRALVTGATGFVGSALCDSLVQSGHHVVAISRTQWSAPPESESLSNSEHSSQYLCRQTADFGNISSIQAHLQGCDAVIHCAARVHQVREAAANPLDEYRRVNTQATLALAQAAAQAGVKRYIFLSSVKVNGEFTQPHVPFIASQARPLDPYGISKWEAEQGLQEIAAKSGLEVVIVRPPLVYGPNVKANFLTMMRWLYRGVPLPLGAIHNQRSLVALPNLLDFISLCIHHPKAANQTFLVSDQYDLSTSELLRYLGEALHRPARLLPVPQSILELALKSLGKSSMVQRLCGDLTVDSSPATQLLGWKPPVTVQQGLRLTAADFLASKAAR